MAVGSAQSSRTRGDTMTIEDLFSIDGKTAVVTGGSRGIGFMIAKGFVEAGASVYITARKAEAADAAAEELSKIGTCVSIPADLSTQEGLDHFANAVSSHESELHVLVNNAGAAWGAKIDEYPASGFDKVLNLN